MQLVGHRLRGFCLAALAFTVASHSAHAGDEAPGALTVERLRCEYRTEPLGIDRLRPELSWIVTATKRAQMQSAYRVLVASSAEKLATDEGDLWDSGKVTSRDTFGILYAGKKLSSHQACYWKAMAWDGEDRPGAWSKPARWTVGLLDEDDWQGDWIGYDGARAANDAPPTDALDGAQWIGHAADDAAQAPAEQRVYFGVWSLQKGVRLAQAEMVAAIDDAGEVLVNGHSISVIGNLRQPRKDDVRAYLHEGDNEIRVLCRNGGPSPAGICLKIVAMTIDGQELTFATGDAWTSAITHSEPWQEQSPNDATPVRVQAPYGSQPWGKLALRGYDSAPPSYLRGTFTTKGPIKRATVYLAALGWADLSLNGKLVNDDRFSSGWTDYRQRVYYRAYEVGGLLREGENAWGAILADGWYSGRIGWGSDRDLYGKKPRVRAMLRVEYADGTTDTFATDKSWTAIPGPRRLADILIGEEYDATQERPGWDEPGFASDKTLAVDLGAEVTPKIEWHPGPPVVNIGEFPAKSVTEPAPGVYVFDLGQNFAGVARLKIRGKRAQQVQLRFAERLNDDGTLYTTNLRFARVIDRYTCRGDGEELWEPRQTFHGFQYVELTGVDEKPPAEAVTGVALSSDTPVVSEFECSDPQLNRLYQNILWTQRANFIDVPTDCPQRDERLGWTGDAQVYAHTASMVCDVQAFFRKWLVDLEDAQRADGQFPKVAPVVLGQEDGGPAWADAGVICPWEMYLAYGDKTLLAQQYPSMVRFIEFCRQRSKDEVLPPKDFHCFGDWLSINADTPKEVIYTAYYARCTQIVSWAAGVLGRAEDARKYGKLAGRIKAAFYKEYVAKDGTIRGDTQCGYVLAIVGDLMPAGPLSADLPPNSGGQLSAAKLIADIEARGNKLSAELLPNAGRRRAADKLIANIEARGNKLSTGFVGTKDLMLALTRAGRNDVALKLLHQQEFPGWMFSINHGATSIWERWDGWTPERGFQDAGMNSFAHYSFGAVYGWMAENLGGIRVPKAIDYRIQIAPTFDPALTHCSVKYDGIRGPIETKWTRSEGRITLECSIPANAEATVGLLGVPKKDVILHDAGDRKVRGFPARMGNPETALVGLKSGTYRIEFPDAK